MRKKSPNRRDFLRTTLASAAGLTAAAGGGYSLLDPLRVLAAEENVPVGFQPKDHYFVFYNFPGGWDSLLSWDPRDPAVFTPATMGETGIYPAYERLLTTPSHGIFVDSVLGKLGGFVGDLRLKKYTDKMCIIRGINMETLAHEAGFLRFRCGRMPEGAVPTRDSTDVVMSALLGGDNLVPNISLGVPSINNEHASYANPLVAGSTGGVANAMKRDNALSAAVENEIQALLKHQAGCAHAAASTYLTRAAGTKATVDAMLASQLSESMDFTANTEFLQSLRAHYGFTASELNSVEARTALAEVALTQHVSRCVSIRAPGVGGGNNYDTHSTLEQGPPQMRAYNAIARLMDRLEAKEYPGNSGDNWLDRTTIVCFSEFTRSPLLEDDAGRGHWLNNVCLLAGGGFKMNQVIGASSDIGMAPRPVDFNTGVVVPNGSDILTPDRIMRTFYTMLGYEWDVADLRVDPLPCLLKTG